MNTNTPMRRRSLLALATMSMIAGCGGGGGATSTVTAGTAASSGTTTTGSTSTSGGASTAGVGTGGTGTGTNNAYALGAISGFGSVIVNGVRYDDSTARVTDDDGVLRKVDDLRLGMTVELRASAITTDAAGVQRATAATIQLIRSLTGVVTSVNLAAGTLVILGQTVLITSTTIFDSVSGLSAIAVNDILEVHALPDAQGRQVATRIERKTAATFDNILRVTGVVSALTANRMEFKIGAVTITLTTPLATGLGNGSEVRVVARATAVANVLAGQTVQARSSGLSEGISSAGIEGYVTAFTSAASFSVNGVPVVTNAATKVEGATTVITLGARIEVEGTVAAGVLTATKVKIKSQAETSGSSSGSNSGSGSSSNSGSADDARFEIIGAITSVNTTNRTFVLRGVTITYDAATELKNGTLALLVVGRTVDVRGVRGMDGTTLQALRIDFNP